VNLWMKRAIGVAALGGGLLAFSAGAASAQEVSADVSARVGRSTSAEVRVCADGRVLSRLLGRCGGQSGSRGTSASVQAGRGSDDSSGVRARVRVPRAASSDVSVGTRRSRPRAAASGQASVAPRPPAATAGAAPDTSPLARASATADLAAADGRLLDPGPLASPAGAGVLGSSPFTLVGDPAADNLLPIGELTLDGLTGEAPAGIGVLESGPIASGNQVGVDAGEVSPTVPATICGNGVGVLGDASAGCGANTSTGGTTAPPPGTTPGQTGTISTAGTAGTAGTIGTIGTAGTIGTTGITGITGLTRDTGGRPGDPVTTLAPLRSFAAGAGALPFSGATSDLLATVAAGLLAMGALLLRAARPAAAREGGDGR
jgi:hypothetical protein